MACTGGSRLLSVPCGPRQPGSPESFPGIPGANVASCATPTQSNASAFLESTTAPPCPLAAAAPYSSPFPSRAVRRHASEVGAVCVSSARTDLCGGCGATRIPTATTRLPAVSLEGQAILGRLGINLLTFAGIRESAATTTLETHIGGRVGRPHFLLQNFAKTIKTRLRNIAYITGYRKR